MSDDLVRRLRDYAFALKKDGVFVDYADAMERQRASDELLRECIQFVSGGAMKLQCNSDESDRQCLNRTKEELLKRITAHLPPPPAKRD